VTFGDIWEEIHKILRQIHKTFVTLGIKILGLLRLKEVFNADISKGGISNIIAYFLLIIALQKCLKVTKSLTILLEMFCEFRPCHDVISMQELTTDGLI